MPKKKTNSKAEKSEIIVELADGTKYSSDGDTTQEALMELDLNYTQVKTKGTITLKRGKKEASRSFYLRPLRRIICNKLMKSQVGRDLEFLLK